MFFIKKGSLMLAVLFSILLILSFHPFNLYFLAPISFFILFLLIERHHSKPFILGLLIFYPFYVFHTIWILHLKTEPGVENYLILGLFFLNIYLSMYPAIFVVLTKKTMNKKGSLFLIPALWVILEYIKSRGVLGFPWMNLYYSQLENSTFVSMASLGGPYFVSFIIVFLGILLYRVIKDKRYLYTLIAVLTFLILVGNILKRNLNKLEEDKSNRYIKIAIIQPNILPQNIYDPKEWLLTKDSITYLIHEIKNDSVELIVLSESAIPGYFRYSFRAKRLIDSIGKLTGADILFGTQDKRKENGEYRIFNTVMLYSNGSILDTYDKHHLVPFGEWLPYQNKLPGILKDINLGWGNFSPGKIKTITFRSHKIGVLICFESIFSYIARALTMKGAEVLVVVTNDGWFGKSKGPIEHFEMARLRAIETGRYVVRSAKTGISAIISPTGKIIKKIPLFTKGTLIYKIPLIKKKTIYTYVGDLIIILSFLIVLVFLVYNKFYTVKERRLS